MESESAFGESGWVPHAPGSLLHQGSTAACLQRCAVGRLPFFPVPFGAFRCHLCVRPFYVNIDTCYLRAGETLETLSPAGSHSDIEADGQKQLPRIRVEFDPAYKVDRVCGTVKQKLTIVYQDLRIECYTIGPCIGTLS